MGAGESTLSFRRQVIRLHEEPQIPETDSEYWDAFTQLPQSAQDIFQLVTLNDIRKAISTQPGNMVTLLHNLCDIIIETGSIDGSSELSQEQVKRLNNAISLLVRVMPAVFEFPQFEVDTFWSTVTLPSSADGRALRQSSSRKEDPLLRRSDSSNTPEAFRSHSSTVAAVTSAPLAERLSRALLNLMFLVGYTVPSGSKNSEDSRSHYVVWEAGIGASKSPASSSFHIQNRFEVLRCLLVLFSKSAFLKPADTVLVSNAWLNFFCLKLEKQAVLSVLCSVLNTIICYDPTGWVPYNHVFFSDAKESIVLLSFEVLVTLLSYQMDPKIASPPGDSPSASDGAGHARSSVFAILSSNGTGDKESHVNQFQNFVSKLHRTADFKIILDGLSQMLTNPLQVNNTYLPYSVKRVSFNEEVLMLFWKLLEFNSDFFIYVSQSQQQVLDITAALLYQSLALKSNTTQIGFLRLCIFVLQLLSGERSFAVSLNSQCLYVPPTTYEVPNFKGTYADLMVLSFSTLIFTTKATLSSLYDCMLTILANISPYCKSLAPISANKLIYMFSAFSTPGFLLENETNHILIFYLLDIFNNILQYQFDGNAHMIYEILRCKETFQKLKELDFETAESTFLSVKQKRSGKKNGESSYNSTENVHNYPSDTMPSLEKIQTIGDSADMVQISEIEKAITNETQPAKPQSPIRINNGNSHGELHVQFIPSREWFEYWRSQLPLNTITALLENLGMKIEQMCEDNEMSDESVMEYLENATLVGLLPVPHPIFVRKFQFSESVCIWFFSYMWGVIYLRHSTPLPTIWIGSNVKLFTVKSIGSS